MKTTDKKREIAVFDFDGTLTTKDSMLEFVKYVKGTRALLLGLLRFAPQIMLMKLRIVDNHSMKEKVLAHFFKGMKHSEFQEYGMTFASRLSEMLNHGTAAILQQHLSEGADVYVVSASVVEWVRPFCQTLGVKNIIGTEMEVDSQGVLTGRFSTHNCYGPEKVRRFLKEEPLRDTYYLYAYGDSKGDYDMFALADKHRKI